jgi:hypothetical protein
MKTMLGKAADLCAGAARHCAHTLGEKLNVRHTVQEIREVAQRYGLRFGVAAGSFFGRPIVMISL